MVRSFLSPDAPYECDDRRLLFLSDVSPAALDPCRLAERKPSGLKHRILKPASPTGKDLKDAERSAVARQVQL
jgi:hypothetical protein